MIISVNENVCYDLMRTASCDPSLEPPRRGSPSEGSQHVFCADISIIVLELSYNNSLNRGLEHNQTRSNITSAQFMRDAFWLYGMQGMIYTYKPYCMYDMYRVFPYVLPECDLLVCRFSQS